MITTLVELRDAMAFERLALAEGFPLLAVSATVAQASLDLRHPAPGATIGAMSIENLGAQARQDLIDRLRPLFFGAAWKVLDLVVELAFYADGLRPQTPGRWRIDEKQQLAKCHRGQCPPWPAHPDLWERICELYAETVEARHCLVHRRFALSPIGDMTDIRDRSGVRKPDVTAAEQEFFSKAAQWVAASTLASALSNRDRSALAWLLDQLSAHHGRPALGGYDACLIEVVRINATRTPSGWIVDVGYAADEVRRVFANRPFYDIEIHFPGTGLPPITAAIEDVPKDSAVPVDPRSPPGWARL